MITLIIGKKGSGKTKKLIDAANNAIENTNGNVVVIEKESHLTLDISHQARLVALEPYGIHGCTAFYGFVSGICAGNYDVTDILIDSTLKITGTGAEVVEELVEKLKKLICRQYGKDGVELTLQEDPSLVGGFILAVGDSVLDKSIRTAILKMQRHFAVR